MIFLQIWFVDFVNALAVFSLLFITNKSLIPIIVRFKMYKVDQKPTTYHIRIYVCNQKRMVQGMMCWDICDPSQFVQRLQSYVFIHGHWLVAATKWFWFLSITRHLFVIFVTSCRNSRRIICSAVIQSVYKYLYSGSATYFANHNVSNLIFWVTANNF